MIDAMTTVSESRSGAPNGPRRAPRERGHEAILEATLDLLVEEGFSRMSIEAVATRAGVGKATIYRRWPSKADLVAEAVACMKDHQLSDVDNGNVRDDLFQLGRQSLKGKDTAEVTDVMIKLMSARARHPELQEAFVRQVIEPRRRIVADVLRRGVERGEIRPDIDVELAMDVILGLVSYRSMVSARHAGISETSLRRLIDVVLDGIATPQARSAASQPAKVSPKAQSRAASSSS
jgi:AcrR family transcriptional regulator